MHRKIVLMLALVLNACVSDMGVPQSRTEFTSMTGTGKLVQSERIVVNKGYGRFLPVFEHKVAECFNQVFTHRVTSGYNVSDSTIAYASTLEQRESKRAELTIQVRMTPAAVRQPPRGFYLLAANISEKTPQQTVVVLYGSSEGPHGYVYRTVKAWVEGGDSPCPKLMGQ